MKQTVWNPIVKIFCSPRKILKGQEGLLQHRSYDWAWQHHFIILHGSNASHGVRLSHNVCAHKHTVQAQTIWHNGQLLTRHDSFMHRVTTPIHSTHYSHNYEIPAVPLGKGKRTNNLMPVLMLTHCKCIHRHTHNRDGHFSYHV